MRVPVEVRLTGNRGLGRVDNRSRVRTSTGARTRDRRRDEEVVSLEPVNADETVGALPGQEQRSNGSTALERRRPKHIGSGGGVSPPDPPRTREHGTRAKYVVELCRCEPCRAAIREYERMRTRAISRPDGQWVPYVDAAPAREHVEWLRSCGLGLKTIAKLSGVPHGSVAKLIYGDPRRGMAPSKRIRPFTERRILAVMPQNAAGHQMFPAAHTWRLLNDLIDRGWTRKELARRLGAQAPSLQISTRLVFASTARRVERLHAELIRQQAPPRRTRWST